MNTKNKNFSGQYLARRSAATLVLSALVAVGFTPAGAAPAGYTPDAQVSGAIGAKYEFGGGESYYGKPLSSEQTTITRSPGAVFQVFEKGTIYWSEETGAFFMAGGTAISEEYNEQLVRAGSDPSHPWIGLPTDDGFTAVGGPGKPGFSGQHFSDGSIFYNGVTGAHTVHGAIHDLWRFGGVTVASGFPLDNLIPVSDEQPVGHGARQSFVHPGQGSGNIFWSEATGAHFVESGVPAGDYYNAHGAVSVFGFPTSEVQQVGDASVLYTEWGVLTVTASGAVFSPLG
ncbi:MULTISPECIES: LGFP repeat-containing protein [Rothia]|uniref:LGFP repeat-containing protein n=1 Tax=Rothia nasimurium TaxID=85336 RepID=A0A1Y1RSF8_9MICC|nr:MULTISPECIES: hypothetical protein [Rothia]ORC24963.1 hypothetical protein A7979_09020 [Rothia nasimurium]